MSQDGLASFEPAFSDELAVIMGWSFEYLQRDAEMVVDATGWQREQTGGSVYLRLTTSPLEQPVREMTKELAEDILAGGYWWRKPGPNCELVIAYQGVVAEQALAAAGQLAGHRRDIGVLAVTSADRLNAGWTAALQERTDGHPNTQSHIENLLAEVPRHAVLLTVIDGHPATLSWIGGVRGMRTLSHGVEHFGQTGTISDLYRHFRLDMSSLVEAVLACPPG
jgi:pyruvate dehydrogenase E1 component